MQLLDERGSRAPSAEFDPYVAHLGPHELLDLYRDMVVVRRLDAEATALQRQGELALWPPLLGQEAAQIGSARMLRPDDFVFSSYREHAVAYARGVDLTDLVRVWRGTTASGWDPFTINMATPQVIIGAQTLHATGYAMGIRNDGADAGLHPHGLRDRPVVVLAEEHDRHLERRREHHRLGDIPLAHRAVAEVGDGDDVGAVVADAHRVAGRVQGLRADDHLRRRHVDRERVPAGCRRAAPHPHQIGEVDSAHVGDGAMSEGDVSEAMVFAASFQVPVVFFCQNNHWAISEPVRVQSRVELADRATGFGIPSLRVDGNDVLAVAAATGVALERARAGGGPTFIEAVTYRMGPHTTADDPTRYRDAAELAEWQGRDPISRLADHLRASGVLDAAADERIAGESDAAAAELRAGCLAIADPPPLAVFDHVYAEPHTTLDRQRADYARYLDGFAE